MTRPNPRHATLALGAALGALAFASAAGAEPTVEKSVKLPVSGVYQIVFNPADGAVYAAATGPRAEPAAAIVRLDGQTLDVEGQIAVTDAPTFGLGLNAETQTLIGTATRVGAVTLVSIADGSVRTIPTPEGDPAHLREVEVDAANNKAYLTALETVWVVDTAAGTLDRIIPFEGGGATGAALDAAGGRLFISDMDSSEIAVLDLATDQIAARYPSGGENAINVVFDDASDRLFVANQDSGTLTVLNSETGEQLASVATGDGALDVAFNPALNQAYVANRGAGTVTVVNGADYSVVANLETGTLPQTLAIDPATNLVYVSNKAQGAPRGAAPGTPAPEDPNGDTITLIRP